MISGTRLVFALLASGLGSIACGPRFDAEADVRNHGVHIHVRKLKPGDKQKSQKIDGRGMGCSRTKDACHDKHYFSAITARQSPSGVSPASMPAASKLRRASPVWG